MTNSITIPNDKVHVFDMLNKEALCGNSKGALSPEDLIVQKLKINYGLGNLNPLDRIHFYDSKNVHQKIQLQKAEVCSFECFEIAVFSSFYS